MMDGPQQDPVGTVQPPMYKNCLQQHAQKSRIQFPVYKTVNEGPQHSPQFRSTVFIKGGTFVSAVTFSTKKAAEQDAARIALEHLESEKLGEGIEDEGIPPIIANDAYLCKSILHEYASKKKVNLPSYSTFQSQGLIPTFMCTVTFAGTTYTGPTGKNKKDAEQKGARTVIECLLGDSVARALICEVIKSKERLVATLHNDNDKRFLQNQNSFVISHAVNLNASNGIERQKLLPTEENNKLLGDVCPDQSVTASTNAAYTSEIIQASTSRHTFGLGGGGVQQANVPALMPYNNNTGTSSIGLLMVSGNSEALVPKKRKKPNRKKKRSKMLRTEESLLVTPICSLPPIVNPI